MTGGTVVILHDELRPDDKEDVLDNLVQTRAVTGILEQLGYDVITMPFSLNAIGDLMARLRMLCPQFVVNLVETIDGSSALCFMACAMLENLRIIYTGNTSGAVLISTNKLLTKRLLRGIGFNTPDWVETNGAGAFLAGARYIIKPVNEEGSVGIDDACIVSCLSKEELLEKISENCALQGRDCFAERYIDGRELNVSMLGSNGHPVVLPISEILFLGYEERALPKIVNYAAKWNQDSYAYNYSVRSFETGDEDRGLIEKLAEIAVNCWKCFELQCYARIDFRVDNENTTWIIDINTNPCISSGSGFLTSAEQAGLDMTAVIKAIVREAGFERI